VNICVLMSLNKLNLEQKISLIRASESRLSYRDLKDTFQVSVGSVSNILKRKREYIDDYECNQNKKLSKSTLKKFKKYVDLIFEFAVIRRHSCRLVTPPLLYITEQDKKIYC